MKTFKHLLKIDTQRICSQFKTMNSLNEDRHECQSEINNEIPRVFNSYNGRSYLEKCHFFHSFDHINKSLIHPFLRFWYINYTNSQKIT